MQTRLASADAPIRWHDRQKINALVYQSSNSALLLSARASLNGCS
jgi:hypothetical protein